MANSISLGMLHPACISALNKLNERVRHGELKSNGYVYIARYHEGVFQVRRKDKHGWIAVLFCAEDEAYYLSKVGEIDKAIEKCNIALNEVRGARKTLRLCNLLDKLKAQAACKDKMTQ